MKRLSLLTFALAFFLSQILASAAADSSLPENSMYGLTRVKLSPTSLNLGAVQSGRVINKWEQIENIGTQTVVIYAAIADATGFQFECPGLPITLQSRATLTCKVGLSPRRAGEYSGTVALRYKWRDTRWHWSTSTINMVAVVEDEAGAIFPLPSSMNFGTLQVSESKSLTATVRNRGKTAFTIFRIVALGRDFSFSEINPPLTLSPGQSVSFLVTCTPKSIGVFTGQLSIESDASKFNVSVPLLGAGVMPGQLKLSSTVMRFGNVVVGTSQKQVATLSAAGGPVTLSSATINNGEFSISGISTPLTINSGRTVSINLTFSPQSSGTSTGMLTLTSTGAQSASTVTIVGTGTPPLQHRVTLSWDPSTSDGVIGYNVYRGTQSGGPYSRINVAPDSTPTDVDDNVSAGQTYYYVITALDSNQLESAYSNEASAIIPVQ